MLITVAGRREIARGIHPAALARGGLRPALESLARRSPLPVNVRVEVGRLPDRVKIAAHYVVSDALTNTAEHARARAASVEVVCEDGVLRVTVRDDGHGGRASATAPAKSGSKTGSRHSAEQSPGRGGKDAYAYASRCYDNPMTDPARAAEPSSRRDARPVARRARWGTISREDVITAAAQIICGGAYEEMSIRSLAAELGVAPMSLYRHIRDKDDLLDEVTDRLLAQSWRPSAPEDDWRAWITEAAEALRHFLVTQPAALHVYLSHPVVSPAAIDRMNAMMDVLRGAGLGEAAAHSAYGALHTYTIGFAALEASRAGWTPDGRDAEGVGRQLAAYTTATQFADGLRYLLEGIGRQTAARPEPSQ